MSWKGGETSPSLETLEGPKGQLLGRFSLKRVESHLKWISFS